MRLWSAFSLCLAALVTNFNFVPGQDTDGEPCFEPGECTGSLYLDNEGTEDPQECLEMCRAREGDCAYFTHYGEDGACYLYANCEELSQNSCSDCYTGSVECPDLQCWLDGGCEGIFVDESYAYDEVACLELCRGDPDCLWFTYKGEDDMCTLLESCEDVDKDCENCVSGQKQCADRPEKTRALVVGGWTDGEAFIDDVDVVDLRGEGDTCNPVADYPFLFRRGVMEIIGGRPWVCGGQIDGVVANPTDQCFEYQKEINTWVEVARLMTARGFPAASMVANSQWFITGGYLGGDPKSVYQTTEVLEDGEFVPGPDLPEPLDHHCQVTLDHDVVFIGSDHRTCYLLDWGTKEWMVLPDPSTTRSQPACGMIRNSDNGQEVVIIGKNSSEILNVNDLTWRNGPSLPNFLDGGAVLQKRTTFSLLGGDAYQPDGEPNDALGTLYDFDAEDYIWREVKGEDGAPVMPMDREAHMAALVDETMINC